MTFPPLISVIIPAHNRAESVQRAIESVRVQTHPNLEIIVVDDGSTDDTYSNARQTVGDEPRLRVLRHDHNRGAQAARNTGIAAAGGSWVAFLDSDDSYLPDSLERRLNAATHEGTSAAHGECLVLRSTELGTLLGTPPMRGDIRRAVLASPGPTYPGLLVKAELLAAIGRLDEDVVAFQEWDTAIRLSAHTRFAFCPDPTFVYDQRGSDTISKDLRRSVAGYEQIVRKHAMAMLRNGGPRVLSGHLLEAARQHAAAGDRWTARSRLLAATALWPFSIRRLWHTAAHL